MSDILDEQVFTSDEIASSAIPSPKPFPLLDLPTDLILEVTDHLDGLSLGHLALTSRRMDLLVSKIIRNRLLRDPVTQNLMGFMNEKDAALYVAATRGAKRAVGYFLSIGAKPYSDKTLDCLRVAVSSRNIEILCALLDAGADPTNQSGNDRTTALHTAVEHEQKAMVTLLLAYGAPMNEQNRYGDTPLHCAILTGSPDLVVCLLDHGASARITNPHSMTSLHFAAKHGHTEIAALLLAYDEDIVDAPDSFGHTPLQYAVYGGSPKIVNTLLSYGADPGVTLFERNCETPLHFAASQGDVKTVEYLVAHGASVTALDDNGKSPIECASENGFKAIVACLLATNEHLMRSNNKASRNHGVSYHTFPLPKLDQY
jgi:ankyrin repeat protein